MQGILYAESSPVSFLLLGVVMGGGAAWIMGRSIAQTWRPFVILVAYAALLTCGIRFIQFAMFESPLLSLRYFVVDYVIILAAAVLGWRKRRSEQMASQYSFAFVPSGPFGWRRKG
jgi:hypothetical protein